MSISIRILKAKHGDSIFISYCTDESVFNILIDGGPSATFKSGPSDRIKGDLCLLLDELKNKGELIDLLILTHIDDDHIAGLLKAFKAQDYLQKMVKSVWFNSSKLITDHFNEKEIPQNNIYINSISPTTSVQQGKNLETLLEEIGCKRASLIIAGQVIDIGPFKFRILSPNQEKLRKLLCIWPVDESSAVTASANTDYSLTLKKILENDRFIKDTSIANGSSIAFILEMDSRKLLFLGDSHEDVVISELAALGYNSNNKLEVDFVKISHHGSQYNTSNNLLAYIKSDKFIISTNGKRHGLPDKRTIARILKNSSGKICFNYESVCKSILLPEEEEFYSRFEVLDKEVRF